MRSRVSLVALAGLFLAVSAGASPDLTAVRYWTAPDHTRVVIDLDGEPVYSTRVLAGPDRLVIMVVDAGTGGAPATTPVGDGVIERVRLNQLERGAQIVIDLAGPLRHNVFPLKPFAGKPHRIVADIFTEAAEPEVPAPAAPESRTTRKVVVIDPGHGGEDPGTLGNGELREKDVVLDVARRLKKLLEQRPGYEVHMTRSGDYFVSLANRKKLAVERQGDIFVSIHGNSAPNRKAHGTELFYVSPRGASDQAARELADRENAADLVGGVSPDAADDVLSILVDLKMDDSVKKSSDLATLMSQRLRETDTSECATKQAGFVVLKSLAMPSVLVEVGFLSNKSDVRKLKQSDYREQYARCMADAIDLFFDRYAPAVADAGGRHTVAPGETLWSIARRYEITVAELREMNGLEPGAIIKTGQVLTVGAASGEM